MRPIIRVEHLSKQYRLGALPAGYVTFRETVANAFTTTLKRVGGAARPTNQKIGRSKMSASRFSRRVVGLIVITGRANQRFSKFSRGHPPTAGSLSFTGARGVCWKSDGFSPDLSGRDNVFLNGAILG